jgi:hypothetical protein
MAYAADRADMWRQVGAYTGQILKGAKPADLPVLQSTKREPRLIGRLGIAELSGLGPMGVSPSRLVMVIVAMKAVLRQRTNDLSEALQHQTGSANILRVIASSPPMSGRFSARSLKVPASSVKPMMPSWC